VLYEELGTARRVQLHQRIGARLEAGYGAQASEIATQLAVHFERGGKTLQAVHYWQQAGDNAARRNAHPEAITSLRKGLALLATLPDSPERSRMIGQYKEFVGQDNTFHASFHFSRLPELDNLSKDSPIYGLNGTP
jgi:predicted ATPase